MRIKQIEMLCENDCKGTKNIAINDFDIRLIVPTEGRIV